MKLRFPSMMILAVLIVGTLTAGGTVFGQTYAPTMIAPNSTETGVAYCRYADGRRVPYCAIRLYTGIYLGTNAHFHDSPTRPFSTVSPTAGTSDGAGNLHFALRTTRVGQDEAVLVEDVRAGLWGNTDYRVGYGDIYWNSHPEMWDLVGGDDTGGGSGHGTTAFNHWMELNAAYGIYYASADYLSKHPEQSKLCMNDMGLPFGGKFDIERTWDTPHAAHDRATAADVGSTGARQCNATNAIPTARMADFKKACVDNGANARHSIVHYDSNHVHCYWDR